MTNKNIAIVVCIVTGLFLLYFLGQHFTNYGVTVNAPIVQEAPKTEEATEKPRADDGKAIATVFIVMNLILIGCLIPNIIAWKNDELEFGDRFIDIFDIVNGSTGCGIGILFGLIIDGFGLLFLFGNLIYKIL